MDVFPSPRPAPAAHARSVPSMAGAESGTAECLPTRGPPDRTSGIRRRDRFIAAVRRSDAVVAGGHQARRKSPDAVCPDPARHDGPWGTGAFSGGRSSHRRQGRAGGWLRAFPRWGARPRPGLSWVVGLAHVRSSRPVIRNVGQPCGIGNCYADGLPPSPTASRPRSMRALPAGRINSRTDHRDRQIAPRQKAGAVDQGACVGDADARTDTANPLLGGLVPD